MRTLLWLPVVFLLAACDIQPPTPLPTLTPSQGPTATGTIDWFPVTDTPTSIPTLTRTPTPNLRTNVGKVLLEDDFSSEGDWVLSSAEDYNVAIANQHLTLVLSRPEWFIFTTRLEPTLDDFYAEITASPNLCRGEDEYGMIVRSSPASVHYRLAVSCDGRAKVTRVSHKSARVIVPWTHSQAIPALAPSSSRLAVWANGQDVRFFINNEYLFSINDTVLFEGTLGVFIRTAGDEPVSVNFSDLVIREVKP